MELHRQHRQRLVGKPLHGPIVEIAQGYLPASAGRHRVIDDAERVILGRDGDLAGTLVANRLVTTAMPELELVGIGPDGAGGPTIDPCGTCEPCTAIAEGRHIDVIEMDAASNTGVDDVREIIEAVRYAAVSARYKIYIIDEVHMLSKNAFNALLKTLEEPPAHVKFLFATTEVNKVPVTVLSRCQRFDLRRIDIDMLAKHFTTIAQTEKVEVKESETKPPPRFNEGTLLSAMEGAGKFVDDEALLVTGSTYVVGSARSTLRSLGFNAPR